MLFFLSNFQKPNSLPATNLILYPEHLKIW